MSTGEIRRASAIFSEQAAVIDLDKDQQTKMLFAGLAALCDGLASALEDIRRVQDGR